MNLYEIRNRLSKGELLSNIPLRVTYYARVSTDHLEQIKSLQNQNEHFYEYIINNPKWIYINGYIDEGISGVSDIKRRNFMQMIEDAKKDKFDLIITKEISRFSRNTLDSIKYSRELLNYGVAVLFINDNINTILSDSELRLTIMASLAQDEVRRLSERIKFGMNRAIKRGEILGNTHLYGYQKNTITKSLEVIPNEANTIKKIFTMYTKDRLSLSKISRLLNDDITISKNNWTTTTISRIITNPKYKGYYCGHKKEVENYMTKKVKYLDSSSWYIYKDNLKIPPIVSEKIWNEANNRLQSRKKNNYSIKKYSYSKKIYCTSCQRVYYRRIYLRNSKDISWVCANHINSNCNSLSIRESELNIIIKYIINILDINISSINNKLLDIYQKTDEIIDINKINDNINNLLEDITLNVLIDKIINKINVTNYYNQILLDIEINNLSKTYQKNFIFKRGYDSVSTKRYSITYKVNYIPNK